MDMEPLDTARPDTEPLDIMVLVLQEWFMFRNSAPAFRKDHVCLDTVIPLKLVFVTFNLKLPMRMVNDLIFTIFIYKINRLNFMPGVP